MNGKYKDEDYPEVVTLRFRNKDSRSAWFGDLLDGSGEDTLGVHVGWNWKDSGRIGSEADNFDTFFIDHYIPDWEGTK